MEENTPVRKGIALAVFVLFIGMSIIPTTGNVVEKSPVSFDGNTLYVGGDGPGNYSKIQDAIDNASDGDTVFVYDDSSPYYENVKVDKSIDLVGEDRDTTVIDGNQTGDVIYISKSANGGTIKGFLIQNSGNEKWEDAGIEVCGYFDCITNNVNINNNYGINIISCEEYTYCREISHNIIADNEVGISIDKNLGYVTPTDVYENYIANNTIGIHVSLNDYIEYYDGIRNNLYQNIITNNEYGIFIALDIYQNVFENNISENKYGVYLEGYHGLCFQNNIYRNNVVRNEDGIVLLDICTGGSYNNNIYLNNLKNNNRGIFITNWETGFCPSGNNIYQNNFIDNNIGALIQLKNKNIFGWNNWTGNYWNRPRILPKIVSGFFFIFPLLNIDWHPAKEPYDIGV